MFGLAVLKTVASSNSSVENNQNFGQLSTTTRWPGFPYIFCLIHIHPMKMFWSVTEWTVSNSYGQAITED